MNKESIEEVVISLLAKTIDDENSKDTWTAETDIINDIGIDSIQLVRFMLSVEDELGISLDFDDLDFDDFSSIGALADYLMKNI